MKRYFLLTILLFLINGIYAQWPVNENYSYDFGTTSGTYNTLGGSSISDATSTGFLPVPTSGAARISIHPNAVNASFVLGGDHALKITQPVERPVKFSNYGIETSTSVVYAKCTMSFSANSTSTSAGSYTWAFGNSDIVAANNSLFKNTGNSLYRSTSEIFSALRWTLSGANTITFAYRAGSDASATTTYTTINNTTFVQGNTYEIEVYCNNSGVDKSYTRNSSTYFLPNDKFHVWVNGIQLNGNLPRSVEVTGSEGLAVGTSIALANGNPLNSYLFIADGAANANGNLTVSGLALTYNLSAETAYSSFDTIIDNVIYSLRTGTSISSVNSGVAANRLTLTSNGTWSDLSYTSSPDAVYSTHLSRISQFALAYISSNSNYYKSTEIYGKILLALRYWIKTNYQSNWWYNQIGYPKELGKILVLMKRGELDLPQSTSDSCLAYLSTREHPSEQQGANRIDEAMHWIYRGALTSDDAVVKTGVDEALSTLEMVSRGTEGLTYDYSFLQHGSQILTHTYGTVWISGLYDVADWIRGTQYGMSVPQLNTAYNFLHHAYYGASRGRYLDFSLAGRQISRINGMNAPNILVKAMRVDTLHTIGLRNDSLRITGTMPASYNIATPYNTHYWLGDYSLHTRPAYSFSVRGVSTRTIRTELVNSENLLGKFLSDGATCIRVTGNEYNNIFPVWDWNKVPGVTMREFATPQTNNSSRVYGNTSFVGGVSDGTYGASTYLLNYVGVNARKSWFFFDNEIVCLGSGITSTETESITTSVNQCLLSGNVTVHTNQNSTLPSSTQQTYTDDLKWVYHNNVGYFFPEGGNVTLSNLTQTGNWYTINTSQTNATVSANVFKMYLNHGSQPTNATYAYIVAPGVSNVAEMSNYNISDIKIISNTTALQAVKHETLGILQIVFVNAGTVTDPTSGIQITVDKPCVLSVKNIGSQIISVSIADPAQIQNAVNVNVSFLNSGLTVPLNCILPGGDYKGSSVTLAVDTTASYTTTKINALADAYVRDGSYADTNYGTSTSLVVKKDGSSGFSRETYIKFDTQSINKPVHQAVLRLYGNGNTTANTTNWALYKSNNTSWVENGITWNNKPTADTLLFTQTGQVGAVYTDWDITNEINQLPAGSLLSLVLVSTKTGSTTDVSFSSKEASDELKRPAIYLSYLPTSENSQLPVNLIQFTAKAENNYVKVNWQTASEYNNSHFELEKSGDGQKFNNIAAIVGKGRSTGITNYSYIDNVYSSDIVYYRLKQVDFNGDFEYIGGIVAVKNYLNVKNYQIFLNDENTLKTVVRRDKGGTSMFRIIDVSGRVMLKSEILLESGLNTYLFDITTLPKGIYIAALNTGGEEFIQKFVK